MYLLHDVSNAFAAQMDAAATGNMGAVVLGSAVVLFCLFSLILAGR